MSVTAYEDERRRRLGNYGDPDRGGGVPFIGAGGGDPDRAGGVVRPGASRLPTTRRPISRPDTGGLAKRVSSIQRPGQGGGNILSAVTNWASGVMDRMGGGVVNQKNPDGLDSFDEIKRQRALEALTEGMPGPFQGNVLSFLSQAREAIGDGGLSDALGTIANREANYKQQAKQSDARLAAMYDQLRGSILDDSEEIRDTTSAAREGMSEIAAEEQKAIADAYKTTQGRQDEVLSRLGIEDAQAISQAQGDVQGRSMREAAERGSTRNAAAQRYTTSVGQNAENLNTSNAAAAGLEGTSRRADVEQQLSAALAALSDERANTQAQFAQANNDRALSLAQTLFSNAQSNWQAQQSNWMDRFNIQRQADDTAYDRGLTEREMALREQAALAEMAAANAQDGPAWNQLNPAQQFNQQLGQMAGNNQAQVAQILGASTRANGMMDRNGALRALQETLGLDPYEANQYIAMYTEALGLR